MPIKSFSRFNPTGPTNTKPYESIVRPSGILRQSFNSSAKLPADGQDEPVLAGSQDEYTLLCGKDNDILTAENGEIVFFDPDGGNTINAAFPHNHPQMIFTGQLSIFGPLISFVRRISGGTSKGPPGAKPEPDKPAHSESAGSPNIILGRLQDIEAVKAVNGEKFRLHNKWSYLAFSSAVDLGEPVINGGHYENSPLDAKYVIRKELWANNVFRYSFLALEATPPAEYSITFTNAKNLEFKILVVEGQDEIKTAGSDTKIPSRLQFAGNVPPLVRDFMVPALYMLNRLLAEYEHYVAEDFDLSEEARAGKLSIAEDIRAFCKSIIDGEKSDIPLHELIEILIAKERDLFTDLKEYYQIDPSSAKVVSGVRQKLLREYQSIFQLNYDAHADLHRMGITLDWFVRFYAWADRVWAKIVSFVRPDYMILTGGAKTLQSPAVPNSVRSIAASGIASYESGGTHGVKIKNKIKGRYAIDKNPAINWEKFQQIFYNLLKIAAKYARSGIEVSFNDDPNAISIVSDDIEIISFSRTFSKDDSIYEMEKLAGEAGGGLEYGLSNKDGRNLLTFTLYLGGF